MCVCVCVWPLQPRTALQDSRCKKYYQAHCHGWSPRPGHGIAHKDTSHLSRSSLGLPSQAHWQYHRSRHTGNPRRALLLRNLIQVQNYSVCVWFMLLCSARMPLTYVSLSLRHSPRHSEILQLLCASGQVHPPGWNAGSNSPLTCHHNWSIPLEKFLRFRLDTNQVTLSASVQGSSMRKKIENLLGFRC